MLLLQKYVIICACVTFKQQDFHNKSSLTFSVWRQNTELKMINLFSTELHNHSSSQCFQRHQHHLHNEQILAVCSSLLMMGFSAKCSASTSVFSGQREQTLCSVIASCECLFESDDALFCPFYLFYFPESTNPSSEDTNCRHRLTLASLTLKYSFNFLDFILFSHTV